ncbi:hypothetical protein C7J88_06115 [Staphylococcus muscae]|uniref:LPXTG-motif cell wall anchor domain-containing protein n=1 Tax=Staphylococcus muscae TaxID=1294 RepID=A0A240C8C8_9STAP|nr:hypothetical protein [Staphylococcus muscae]AVQ33765.1 hypothetical protein C7J88_06115 [Staphylococcus muscae]PNZ06273.1 hypothetical protein CD131_00640 [Staphylococcus muscae]GGA87551.1 hypothetical protein GCM10007183_09670 [Staphylococcus muscae]SNW04210.1 Uncharacterised protein [Staphylococcus muscae]
MFKKLYASSLITAAITASFTINTNAATNNDEHTTIPANNHLAKPIKKETKRYAWEPQNGNYHDLSNRTEVPSEYLDFLDTLPSSEDVQNDPRIKDILSKQDRHTNPYLVNNPTIINKDFNADTANSINQNDASKPLSTQAPQPSHTQLTVLPNTGGVHSVSPLAIYSLLLLGGALVVYRPFSSVNKSKV